MDFGKTAVEISKIQARAGRFTMALDSAKLTRGIIPRWKAYAIISEELKISSQIADFRKIGEFLINEVVRERMECTKSDKERNKDVNNLENSVLKNIVNYQIRLESILIGLGYIFNNKFGIKDNPVETTDYKYSVNISSLIDDIDFYDEVLQNIAIEQARLRTSGAVLEAISHIQSKLKQVEVLTEILKDLALENSVTLMLNIANKISDGFEKAQALYKIAKFAAGRSNIEVAYKVCEKAIESIKTYNIHARNFATKRDFVMLVFQIGLLQEQIGKIQEANQTFSQGVTLTTELEPIVNSSNFRELVRYCIDNQNFDRAIDIARYAYAESDYDETIIQIIRVKIGEKDYPSSLSLVKYLKSIELMNYVLKEIAKNQAEDGLFRDGINTALLITDQEYKARSLMNIAKLQIQSSYEDEAIQTVDKISHQQDEYLLEIADELAHRENLTYFYKLIIPCAYSPKAALNICRLLAQNNPPEALQILQEIVNIQ